MTVSQTGGDLLGNLNRWHRDQLGLKPLGRRQIEAATKPLDAGGLRFFLVDWVGPGGAGPKMALPPNHP